MQSYGLAAIGSWAPGAVAPAFSAEQLIAALHNIREPAHIVQDPQTGCVGIGFGGETRAGVAADSSGFLHLGTLPALYPEWLGDRSFLESHGVRFPYIAGAMYQGIASTDMVIAMGQCGMIGFFGAAGLPVQALDAALGRIRAALDGQGLPWGTNLIYTPTDPKLEEAIVDLYLKIGARRVSAAAFMALSPNIVRYSATGLHQGPDGRIQRRNHVFAKLSRPEVAELFMSPAPGPILDSLVAGGKLTAAEAALARQVPIAEDITVEADSGGHTDNRPLPALLPTVLSLRDRLAAKFGYDRPIRVGAAGGLGTPSAVAGAFAMGAAYVLIGSVNQSAVESGMSPDGRALLAVADVADVTMAPAADMFELGVKVQVLKRGTMFPNRAAQLYEIYSQYGGIDAIPEAVRGALEKNVFRAPLETIWADTRAYFDKRNPEEIAKAEKDPKHKMALVFRWYLGNSARWAMEGDASHRLDYQICCGPAMGAFNSWVKGSFLEKPENRNVRDIALNLLEGAAVVTRCQQARSYGVPVPAAAFDFRPRPLTQG